MSDLQQRLASLSPAKRALLERMLLERAATRGSHIAPRPADSDDSLSGAEQRLWFVDQIAKDDPFYNMPLAARLRGRLDRKSLESAVSQLVERHESLRTTYHLHAGQPQRRVHASLTIPCAWFDLSGSRDVERDLQRRMRVASRAPFDLENGPLLRICVYRLAEDEHVILLVMHHIISDGWSMIVMLRELTLAYEMAAPLPPLPIQYADFAHWQNEQMSEQRIERQLAYWRETLADAPAVLNLPTDRARPAIQDFVGATVELELSADLTQAINQAAASWQTTPFAILLAAEAVLLGRISGQRDVVLGTASAGRVHPEIEPLIGFFVNTLALRVRLDGDLCFADLVRQVHRTVVEAHEHADVPFERLIEELAPVRDRSFSPLFQTALVMQNLPRDISEKGSIEVAPMLVDNGTAKYDLTFFLWEEAGRLIGHVEYRASLFDRPTIKRLIDSYRTLLTAAMEAADTSIERLPLLSIQQRQQVLADFNQTTHEYPGPFLLHQLVAGQAQRFPEKVAVHHGDCEITYRKLMQRAEHYAAHFIAAGVQPESAVVIVLPRSIELIAAVLGVLQAGGSFVPVDPEFPSGRIARIAADTGARVVVDHDWIAAHQHEPSPVRFPEIAPRNRAYVIFTSGSTGQAKGVEIEHRGIVNFIRAQIDRMGLSCEDRFSFAFSPAFDGAVSEIFYSLGCGGTCVVVDKPTLLIPGDLTRLLNQQRVTVGKFPPALLSTLDPTQLPGLRTVASAGDKLTGELARRWVTDGRRLFNGYGPTEVSVGVSMMELSSDWEGEKPPIGRPMNNMRMYVLDEHQQPLPIGVTGEIYIAGRGVARGYLGQPEQTDEVFLPDPFVSTNSDSLPSDEPLQREPPRMYRTGDLGRWLPTGVVEFIGRADDQVSLRGFRIEPGEIAATLETLATVRQAVVIERTDNETAQLVAYVVPQTDTSPAAETSRLESEHVTQWRSLFDQTHRLAPPVLDPAFNITGWVSTYTGTPIPAGEMRSWTDGAVARILDLRPNRVLEIGCGTGLLLLRIAAHCDRYVGSDLLESSLENIRSELSRRPELTNIVSLAQANADQFDHLNGETFDCVVLNSVVQYFPAVDYFLRVLAGAIDHVAPGGTLFIGDVRNLQLQTALAVSIERFQAAADLSIAELKHRVAARIENEEELLLDPKLFAALKTIHPRIKGVCVQLKDAAETNELGRFRYDVTLHLDDRPAIEAALQPLLTGIPNARVALDVRACELIDSLADTDTVADLNAKLTALESSLDLQEPNAVLANLDQPAVATWNDTDPAHFDVIALQPQASAAISAPLSVPPETSPVDFTSYANDPIGSERSREFTKQLRELLVEKLPAYMIPSAFVILDALPRTVNGKIDRSLLPPPTGRPAWAGQFAPPTTPTQTTLVQIWEELLGTRPIGIDDNFFDLGGHSMLAVRMTSAVEQRLGKRLPLVSLFQNATISHLAAVLDQGELATLGSTLIPLRKSQQNAELASDSTPLFCIHPAGGTVFCYLEMASHLRAGRAVYGIQANGIDGTQPPHETLAEMAAHYARAIREIHPTGDVHLAGWSLGGNIAFEVARQLQSRGTQVGILALLDAGLLSPDTQLREQDFLPLLSALFPAAMNLDLEQIRQQDPAEQLQFFVERAAQAGIVADDLNDIVATKETANAAHVFGVFQANVKAVHEYVAQPYAGDVHLFRPVDQGKTNSLFDDPILGWRDVTNHVHTHSVPGDHAHMLQSPAAQSIAQQLDELMHSY